jgi:hypothetical protein
MLYNILSLIQKHAKTLNFSPLRATPKKNQSFTLVLFFCPPVSRTLEHYASQGFGWFPPFKAKTFALIFLF